MKIATGGSRGDFAHVGLDGRLFVTQSDQVVVLYPALPPRVVATSPVVGSTLMTRTNRATITFDVDMQSTPASRDDSVFNPANYKLTNTDTGQVFTFVAVNYEIASRTRLPELEVGS